MGFKSKRTMRRRGLCDGFPLFLLKSCDHLLHATMFAARCEHFQTLFLRSPLQDVDIHVTDAPASHCQPARFIKVYGIGADECPSIIVDNVFLVRGGDAKPCAKRITRPIGCGTHHVAAGKIAADCVVESASLTMRIGSGAHVWYVARAANARFRLSGTTND